MFLFVDDNAFPLMFQFLIGFLISWTISSYTENIKFIDKNNFNGPQKIHENFTPRYGGISIFLSTLFFLMLCDSIFEKTFLLLLISSLPAYISGLLEDFTNKIKPKIRLFASIISALLMVTTLNIKITHIGIGFFDYYLGADFLSLFVTIFSCVILIQAYNIIDGLNGLSSINFISMLISVNFISIQIDDYFLIQLSTILIVGVLGFFVFNFPFGKVFLGDGGAYLIGFLSAFTVIFLSQRNEIVYPAASLLLIIFPVYELFRSTFRRSLKNIKSIFEPDNKHLHSVVYKKNLINYKKSIVHANSFSTIQISVIPIFSSFWCFLFYDKGFYIYLGIVISICLFEIMYYKFSNNDGKKL